MGKTQLSAKDRLSISLTVHGEFLRMFMMKTRYTFGDIIFHGGTSLHIIHQSPRFSEDLDFMVDPGISLDDLGENLERIAPFVGNAINLRHAETTTQWKAKTKGGLLRGVFVVGSAQWHGTVKVKVECYSAKDLAKYKAFTVALDSGVAIPAATLESIMGDKVVALAMRPFFKERDAFDVWLLYQKGVAPQTETIQASANVYGKTLLDINEGLESLPARMESKDIQSALIRWLPNDLYELYSRSTVFDDIREAVMTCRDDALDLTRPHL